MNVNISIPEWLFQKMNEMKREKGVRTRSEVYEEYIIKGLIVDGKINYTRPGEEAAC